MRKINLLLVDDEAEYVKTMAERLQMRDVGSRVAFSGEEALRMVEDDAPDVMVLDLRMPGIDGMRVLERVRAEHPHVQVIILTGHGSEREEREARRLAPSSVSTPERRGLSQRYGHREYDTITLE